MQKHHRLKTKIIALCLLFAAKTWAHPGAGIVVDKYGRVYFVLSGGPHNRIILIDAHGKVTPFIVDERLHAPHHLIIDQKGNLYTVSANDGIVWKIAPDGMMTEFYSSQNEDNLWRIGAWGNPFTIDQQGNIYSIDDSSRVRILKITPEGKINILAGSEKGYADGKSNEAKFGDLHSAAMVWGPEKLLYITDGSRIRKVASDGTVSTLAISQGARLGYGAGIAIDARRNVYVADIYYRQILKITPEGKSTRLAGLSKGSIAEKTKEDVRLLMPTGIAIDRAGNIYVLDNSPEVTRVWKIAPNGKFFMFASGNNVLTN